MPNIRERLYPFFRNVRPYLETITNVGLIGMMVGGLIAVAGAMISNLSTLEVRGFSGLQIAIEGLIISGTGFFATLASESLRSVPEGNILNFEGLQNEGQQNQRQNQQEDVPIALVVNAEERVEPRLAPSPTQEVNDADSVSLELELGAHNTIAPARLAMLESEQGRQELKEFTRQERGAEASKNYSDEAIPSPTPRASKGDRLQAVEKDIEESRF